MQIILIGFMEFIGRDPELKILEDTYRQDTGFVVLYGRRRVGKTTLISKFIANKPALYYLATEEREPDALRRFGDAVAAFTNRPYLKNGSITDWIPLFTYFAEEPSTEKKILVIDEFPYLVHSNPAFPSLFQKIWDEILQNASVMVILCGSSVSMMKDYALARTSPLYGRRTAQIKLKPLRFMELATHFPSIPFSELVERYALTGGIPKYLTFFDTGISVQDAIKKYVLNPNGYLYEEPLYLLKNDVRDAPSYLSIMNAISQGYTTISQIADKIQSSTSFITPYLATLIELGFVERKIPILEEYPEKSRKGVYRIADTFMRFWFRFVYPNRSLLEQGNYEPVMELINQEMNRVYLSFIYEDICAELFSYLCTQHEISFTPYQIGSYWNRTGTIELDLVAVNPKTQELFIGECKYYTGKKMVGTEVMETLQKKIQNKPFSK